MSEAEFERREGRDVGEMEPISSPESESSPRGIASPSKSRVPRAKPAKARRVQRMFAIEEDVDKKLWLYAIHVGKDRSEVVNELLKPLVASMVLYDSRDRRASARAVEAEGQGGEVAER